MVPTSQFAAMICLAMASVARAHEANIWRNHTILVIQPREEWAKLFLDWMKEIREIQE
jgi:hypothetical protein